MNEYENSKLVIYEAEYTGIINESQRDSMLELVEESFFNKKEKVKYKDAPVDKIKFHSKNVKECYDKNYLVVVARSGNPEVIKEACRRMMFNIYKDSDKKIIKDFMIIPGEDVNATYKLQGMKAFGKNKVIIAFATSNPDEMKTIKDSTKVKYFRYLIDKKQ